MVRESDIEDYLCKRVTATGGEARKVKWIGRRGAPDRLIFYPNGFLVFVELKAPGKKPEPHQLREIERLRTRGQEVRVIDSLAAVEALIEDVFS